MKKSSTLPYIYVGTFQLPPPLLVYFGSNENIIRKLKKSHQNS